MLLKNRSLSFFRFVLTLILCFSCNGLIAQEIRVISAQSDIDRTGFNYFVAVLEIALNEANSNQQNYYVQPVHFDSITQKRAFKLLKSEKIDLFWAGTSQDRENVFSAIPIPVMKGLLGYRVSIIHKRKRNIFQQLSNDDLKNMLACQGSHWPDAEILRGNDFRVIPVAKYELMFKMLNAGRCDYFPRAIFEAYDELKSVKAIYPDLEIFDNLVLHYQFPTYFFTHSKNKALKQHLQLGLEKAIANKKLLKLMSEHPFTKHLFPLSQWKQKTFIELANPVLTESTKSISSDMWLNLQQR